VTGTTAHSPGPDTDWPAARHRDLLDGLNQHLDPDAGLRDIMLHADHADLTAALSRQLDTQAGLAAILPAPPAAASRRTPGQPGTTAAIAATDPSARLALRRNPITLAVILSDLTVRALMITDKADVCARDLAPAVARDLARADDLARGGIASARGLLSRDLSLARDLARDIVLARDRDLERDLARDLVLILAHALSRDLIRGRLPGLVLTRDLARDLNLARDIARQTALVVADILGLRQVEGLAAALLEGALDDFTHADLTCVDLAGSDLTGIRWSDWGTAWPPGTNTDELRARSQEIAPGIYEITRPGHGNKARHHTSA
jgi:hypothetical protein